MRLYPFQIVTILFFLALFFSTGYGDYYKFTDRNGVIHFTNAPVDLRYKKFKSEGSSAYKSDSSEYTNTNSYEPLSYQEIISMKSSKYNVHPDLVKAIIRAESNWNPMAVSRKGAKGLMQLMPGTASDMGISNPMDPEQNIEGGTRYISMLLNLFNGNLDFALAAYNAGPGAVKNHGGIPPYRETINYVKRVNNFFSGKGGGNPIRPVAASNFNKKGHIYKTILGDGTILYTNYLRVK
ncbi:MAG TPA: transglycosylase SLT domain-containing protein [Thermodesulfovibrionia bacterium]|nr:transglycosylase SLT domain-containing protein [Thermodesulfovibrionia bacterium]